MERLRSQDMNSQQEKFEPGKVASKDYKLSSKIFKEQHSLFTEILNLPKCKFLYGLAIGIFVNLLISTVGENYLKTRELNFGLRAVTHGFGNFHYAILTWLILFLLSLICHPVLNLWAKLYCKILEKSLQYNGFFNLVSIYLLICYYIIMLVIPTIAVYKFDLPPMSSFVILCEEVRIIMKIHSYVRSNVPKTLKFKPHADDYPILPEFDKFWYFHFAPTLIYQDEYPRTKTVNWSFIKKCFLQMIFTIFLMSVIFERFTTPFENICKEKTTFAELLLAIWQNSFYGMICLIGFGFIMLHCWLNAFSELLRFGDRLFYKDWWNTPSYLQYYRLWNDVVQDWLFTYIYKDMYEVFRVRNKTLIKVVIFFISAVFHEYILGVSTRLFFPANFIFFFGGSLMMMAIKKDFGNIFVLCTIGFGFSIQISLYSIEYYATKNCPIPNPSVLDILTPRISSCNCIVDWV